MFFHHDLYDFWFRSKGVWVSKLVKVTVGLLDEEELLAISQIHKLSEVEFGVKMDWNYVTKDESGQMSWCVDANQPNLVFTSKSLNSDTPRILDYQMIEANKLVIKFGKLEETFYLENDNKRLRELRQEGKLLRRLWEEKLSA